ncbi:MAG: TVP38/TMEM64 family protein [Candidatus Pacebacteria bacterium]|nr:TVP38/TMEM64 family protein [Candidatus Paceibacterota bacterium]
MFSVSRTAILRIFLILLFVSGFIAAQLFGVGEYLSLTSVQGLISSLTEYTSAHLILSSLIFIGVYIIVIGFSLPGATILTLTSGALFGAVTGTLLTNVGATIGATLSFLAARFIFGIALQEKYATKLVAINEEMEKNAVSYLLTLRFVPVFPFFLINVLSGLSRIPLRTFVWVTSLGILPGSFVYAFAGQQIASLTSVKDVLSLNVIIALVLLGIFAIAPTIYKKISGRNRVKDAVSDTQD